MFMVNATEARLVKIDDYIMEMLENNETPVFLVINKIDQIHPDELLKIIDSYKSEYDFAEIFQFLHYKEIM